MTPPRPNPNPDPDAALTSPDATYPAGDRIAQAILHAAALHVAYHVARFVWTLYHGEPPL